MSNPFHIDPWEAAKRHYEKQMLEFMVKLMRHFGVTQVEMSWEPLPDGVLVEWQDTETGRRFYRVKGHLHCIGDHEGKR